MRAYHVRPPPTRVQCVAQSLSTGLTIHCTRCAHTFKCIKLFIFFLCSNWRRTLDPGYRKTLYSGVRPWLWEARDVDRALDVNISLFSTGKYNCLQMARRGQITQRAVRDHWMGPDGLFEQDAGHSLRVGRRITDSGWTEYLEAMRDSAERYLAR